jgi:hypothetical protein
VERLKVRIVAGCANTSCSTPASGPRSATRASCMRPTTSQRRRHDPAGRRAPQLGQRAAPADHRQHRGHLGRTFALALARAQGVPTFPTLADEIASVSLAAGACGRLWGVRRHRQLAPRGDGPPERASIPNTARSPSDNASRSPSHRLARISPSPCRARTPQEGAAVGGWAPECWWCGIGKCWASQSAADQGRGHELVDGAARYR